MELPLELRERVRAHRRHSARDTRGLVPPRRSESCASGTSPMLTLTATVEQNIRNGAGHGEPPIVSFRGRGLSPLHALAKKCLFDMRYTSRDGEQGTMTRRLLLLVACAACASTPPAPSEVVPPAPTPVASSSSSSPLAASTPDAGDGIDAGADAGASSDERAVVAALERARADLVRCHRESKNATGELTLRITLGVNGKVEATSNPEPPTVPAKLAKCVEARVRSVQVDITPTSVTIPFRFKANAYDGPMILIGNGPFDPGY